MVRVCLGLFISLILTACHLDLPEDVAAAYQEIKEEPDFNLDVRPILSDKCFSCHGPDQNKLKAGLRLDDEGIAKGFLPENPGKKAIIEGSTMHSQVVSRILIDDAELKMPPPESNLLLSPQEKAVLIKWIENGAPYKPHWSFIPPEISPVPSGMNPVDYFISRRHQEKDLAFAERADKETLLRRLSLDLTGLPPSIEDMDAFLNDVSADAYERQVDRLLASRHYGERMATEWMDAARYADTHGYTVDRYRDVSPWRDWVIESFNSNMPYDQFFTLQLAGDLQPNVGKKEKIATTFLRLHPQNMEGGIVPEEFRVEYVADRTNTVGTAFMGMTIGCAKCHDHKFDPISQREYFQLFSFFNNLNEAGQISFDNMMPVPTLLLTNEKQDSIIRYFEQKIDSVSLAMDHIEVTGLPEADQWIASESYKKIEKNAVSGGLMGFYLLDNHLRNQISFEFNGRMSRHNSDDEKPTFVEGKEGMGLLMDGDAWLDLGGIAAFDRYQPFSIGIAIKLPAELRDGVILHKGIGAALYNFKGFHLALKENKLELLMAHTMPDNAIVKYAETEIPRDTWVDLFVTYDGSSQADGYRIFMNGRELTTQVDQDKLYKGILFGHGENEPGIQVGARWRGKGIGGAIVDNIRIYNRDLTSLEVMQITNDPGWEKIRSKPFSQLSREEHHILLEYYYRQFNGRTKALRRDWLEFQKERSQYVEDIGELMVYEEMSKPRPTFILDRGAYYSPTERVYPGTPVAILPMDSSGRKDRLQLARWLADADHPLTARVMVNRLWQQLFGRGLVLTAEDFGNQGSNPSHPLLLDHLAVVFRENDWNIKHLLKLLVMSQTYCQSSNVRPHLVEQDPENKLYARGPAQRLSAEMLRDQALAASGLLNTRIGGPSVRPYQPEGLWKVNGAAYDVSSGEDLYRRSLYTIWKRSVPHPTQSTFDAPERSECVMRRQETNTPLQALVLMNDPIYVEAAQEIGVQMEQQDDIESAYRRLAGRYPLDTELAILEELYDAEYQKFKDEPEKATGWIIEANNNHKNLRQAAYAVVASTIINSDAFITKR